MKPRRDFFVLLLGRMAGIPAQLGGQLMGMVEQFMPVACARFLSLMSPVARRSGRVWRSLEQLAQEVQRQLEVLVGAWQDTPGPRCRIIGRKGERPVLPLPVDVLVDDPQAVLLERRVPGGQWRACGPPELLVDLANQLERVLIEADPDVESVLLNPIKLSTATCALAAESPTELVYGDLF